MRIFILDKHCRSFEQFDPRRSSEFYSDMPLNITSGILDAIPSVNFIVGHPGFSTIEGNYCIF